MRRNPKYETGSFPYWCDWFKWRSYETRKMAEENLVNANRKWNPQSSKRELDYWEFEIREKQ